LISNFTESGKMREVS